MPCYSWGMELVGQGMSANRLTLNRHANKYLTICFKLWEIWEIKQKVSHASALPGDLHCFVHSTQYLMSYIIQPRTDMSVEYLWMMPSCRLYAAMQHKHQPTRLFILDRRKHASMLLKSQLALSGFRNLCIDDGTISAWTSVSLVKDLIFKSHHRHLYLHC
jgi:hypothetical protein